jgi:polyisoprenoid-binding protein YceI
MTRLRVFAAAVLAGTGALWGSAPAVSLAVDVRATLHRFTAEVAHAQLQWETDPETGAPRHGELTFRWSEVTTGNATRDRELRAWVQADRWPEGRFQARHVEVSEDGNAWHVRGELMLRDTTRPVELTVRRENATSPRWSGSVEIDHREWGLPRIRRAGLLTVEPVVTVRFVLKP